MPRLLIYDGDATYSYNRNVLSEGYSLLKRKRTSRETTIFLTSELCAEIQFWDKNQLTQESRDILWLSLKLSTHKWNIPFEGQL